MIAGLAGSGREDGPHRTPVKAELHPLPEAFDRPVWSELLRADPHRHVFATVEWGRLWWESFGARQERGFVLELSDPDPFALTAFTIDQTDQGRRLRFLGGEDLTDYQGPIVARGREADAAGGLLDRLPEIAGWDYLLAQAMPVPFHFSEWLVEGADRRGLEFDLELNELSAVLMLPADWPSYLGGLSRKRRHELERKMRRFEREAPGAALRTSDSGTVMADIETFIRLHKASAGEKGGFMLPAREAFFRELARALHPLGMLSLDLLERDGRPMAATIGFRYEDVFYLYNSAYDLDLRPISPGLMLVARLIHRSILEGLRRFDFLKGRERYKYDLGAEALPLHRMVIPNPGPPSGGTL